MKKFKLVVAILFISFSVHAQYVFEKLNFPTGYKLKEGLLVCGIKPGNNPEFEATLYDKDLKVLKKYSKELGAGVICKTFTINERGELLQIFLITKGEYDFLWLNKDLKEVLFEPWTKEKGDKIGMIRKAPDKESSLNADDFAVRLSNYDLSPVNNFLHNDLIAFNDKETTIGRFQEKEKIAYPVYKNIWKTELGVGRIQVFREINEYIPFFTQRGITEFISIDDNNIFATVTDVSDKKRVSFFLYCFDSKTGAVKYKTPMVFSGDKGFVYSKGYYDASANKVILVGDVYDFKNEKKDNRVEGVGVIMCNFKGEIEKVQKLDIPIYTGHRAMGYKYEEKATEALKIGKLANGNYFIHCANYANRDGFRKVGFSRYEVSDKLELKSTQLVMIDKDYLAEANYKGREDQCRYFDSSDNGSLILLGVDFKKKRLSEVVDFNIQEQEAPKEIFSYKYDASSGSKRDYQYQFMIENSIIILSIEDDQMVLKVNKL